MMYILSRSFLAQNKGATVYMLLKQGGHLMYMEVPAEIECCPSKFKGRWVG